jgi:hypothetical protein
MAAQVEPTLTMLNMPRYSRMARQARVQGIVKVAFTLPPHAGGPMHVELVLSGPQPSEGKVVELLKESAVENVKTWRFENHDAVEHRYETTFEFRLSPGKDVVSFQSFHSVTIVAGDNEGPVID